MSRPRSLRVAVATVAILAVAGCAGVPDSGSVHLGAPVAATGQGLEGGAVREVPALPRPDASPVQLVSGFLGAMVDGDNGYAVARSYLGYGTPWSTGSGITVYAAPPKISRVSADQVTVRARRVGEVGPRATYRVLPGLLERTFTLSHRSGQWRITKLASGALLSADDIERVLEPASIYFLTPDGHRVVPSPVLESPEEPGLATTLMRALLAGPDRLLAPGVRTAVPRGTSLVGNVPISAGGVAEVDLSAGARQITPPQLVELSAQIVWTLRQIFSVTAVRLLANGTPLTTSEVPSLQSVRSWPQFDPGAPPTVPGALLVRDGKVTGLDAVVPPSLRSAGLLDPVTSADGSLVAALRMTPTGEQLLMGDADAGRLRVRLQAARLSAPSFGPDGRVLVAGVGGTVYSIGNDSSERVQLPAALSDQPIRALAVSRDGTRLALVLGGGELRVATLADRDGVPVVTGSRIVLPAAADAAGVTWSDADQLVTTVGQQGGSRRVVGVGVDGYTEVDLSGPGLPSDVDVVAAAPGQPVLASGSAAAGSTGPGSTGTWRFDGHRWERVSAGVSPSYAG